MLTAKFDIVEQKCRAYSLCTIPLEAVLDETKHGNINMKKQIVFSLMIALGVTGLAYSADDPIATRKAMMQNVGAAAKVGGMMLKGETEFNAITAELLLRTMNTASLGFGELYPEGSETGGKTTASPAIWEDRAGFDAAIAKFQTDTAAAIAAKPADLDAFKAAFGSAASNCGTCHKAYRVSKE